MTIRSITLTLAAAAALAVPATAFAARDETAPTIGVHYKDLNLATAAGQKELESRLDKAARQVCGMDEVVTGSRMPSREASKCYRDARQQLGESLAQVVRNSAAGG